MRVLKTFQPGALGARRFTARFGKSLVCVRYRHDPDTGARFTTVELIVEETRVYCRRPKADGDAPPPPASPLWVKIGRGEILLRQQVKAAGGIWRYPEMVWEVTPEVLKRLRLRDRLVRVPRSGTAGRLPSPRSDAYPWMPTDTA
jgi:hypothetical protein